MNRAVLVLVIFITSVCGCAVRAADAVPGAGMTITLEEAYDRTLETDQSIRIAYYEVRTANLLPWSALTRLGPQLTGNASYTRSEQTLTGPIKPTFGSTATRSEARRIGVTLEQPLIDLTVFPAYRVGNLTAQSARLDYEFTVRGTLFGVARAYYAVLRQESVVRVDQQTVGLASDQLKVAQSRYDVGDVARTDVLRARATLEGARRTLIESQNALALVRNTLGNILNLGGDTGFRVAEPQAASAEVGTFEAALGRAYALREDYKISALAVDRAIASRAGIMAEYGPRVVAQGSQQWNDSNRSVSDNREWQATVSVQMPFLTGGQREIDLVTASHQIKERRLELEQTAKSIQEDVKNAWLLVQTLRETLKALRAEVVASEQNYHDLQTQYRAGAATSLDVQTALRDLNDSLRSLTVQTYDYQVALRDLQRAQAIFQEARVNKARFR